MPLAVTNTCPSWQGFKEVLATTTSGQPAAIALYMKEGFRLRSAHWYRIVHLHDLVLDLDHWRTTSLGSRPQLSWASAVELASRELQDDLSPEGPFPQRSTISAVDTRQPESDTKR